ncbi:MAG: glycosyltransferase family 4 protein [Armatimonadetes bacterium]|nr:glycosyltransferase family 4 protein [Armatimonadota bacterium]
MRVAVFHPGTQHSYQSALAFQEADCLAWYATGVYYDPERWPFRAARWMPPSLRAALERESRKRHLPDLDRGRIITRSGREWCVLLAQRLRMLQGLAPRVIHWRNRRFSSWAGRCALGTADTVYGYDTSSLEAFRIAREHGLRTVLDQSGSSWPFVRQALQTETEVYPDYMQGILRRTLRASRLNEERYVAELALADVILVGCSFAAETLPEGVGREGRTWVVPYGATLPPDPRPQPDPPADGRTRLLYAGAISPAKGVYYLLEAMRLLGSQNLSLDLVGRLDLDPRLFGPYRKWVRHTPHVPRQELDRLYAAADAFVFPSLTEGFGIVLIEAAAAGLPLIATTSTGAPDLVGDSGCGFLVPPRDPAALAERIDYVASHRQERLEMGRRARQRARLFTWEAYRRRLRETVLPEGPEPHQANGSLPEKGFPV